jgi:uncharacterized membrane protein
MAEAMLEKMERWVVRSASGALGRPRGVEVVGTALVGVALLVIGRRSAWRVPAFLAAAAAMARAASLASTSLRTAPRRMSTQETLSGGRGEDIEETITIARPLDEVYGFWRTLSSFSEATRGRISVTPLERDRSHWQLHGRAGTEVPLLEWTAEIVNEVPGKLVGWRTTSDADVASAGSVHFAAGPAGHDTEIRVHLRVAPPLGRLGAALAWPGVDHPAAVVREALRDVKRYLELGRSDARSTPVTG